MTTVCTLLTTILSPELVWHYTLAWFPFTCPGQDDPDNHIEIRIKKETYLLPMKNSKFSVWQDSNRAKNSNLVYISSQEIILFLFCKNYFAFLIFPSISLSLMSN